MKEFVGSFLKGQILLLAPQPILLLLTIFNRISLYYGAPVIVCLSVLWGWFDYSGKAQRRVVSVLRKLDGLVDDFGRLNFQQGNGPTDSRIVKLLDKASFGTSTSTTPEMASATIDKIKEVYFTFQLWYFSMRHKVKVLIRKASSMVEYDLVEVANEFIEFYSDFVEKVAEGTLRLVGKGDMAGLEGEREAYASFSTHLSELRGRANAFLQGLHDDGLPISGTRVRALDLDPWVRLEAGTPDVNQNPVD